MSSQPSHVVSRATQSEGKSTFPCKDHCEAYFVDNLGQSDGYLVESSEKQVEGVEM